jgi:hypothetical protein
MLLIKSRRIVSDEIVFEDFILTELPQYFEEFYRSASIKKLNSEKILPSTEKIPTSVPRYASFHSTI